MFRKFCVLLLMAMLICIPAQAASGLEVTQVLENGDGTVTIFWKDANANGPYEIGYREKFEDDYDKPATVNGEFKTFTFVTGDVKGTLSSGEYSYTTMRYIPGVTQWFVVEDSDGNTAAKACSISAGCTPTHHGSVEVTACIRVDDGTRYRLDAIPADGIAYMNPNYGVAVEVNFDAYNVETVLNIQLILTAPNGVSFPWDMTNYTIEGDSTGLSYSFIDMEDAGYMLMNTLGIQDGVYTVTVYFNGEKMGSDTFEIEGSFTFADYEKEEEEKEETTPRPAPDPGEELCSYCGGHGMCEDYDCALGMCMTCNGIGEDYCSYCYGGGDCQYCYGMGGDYDWNMKWHNCSICHGSGNCTRCDHGYTTCKTCRGTGKCTTCHGTGYCNYCNGTGYR